MGPATVRGDCKKQQGAQFSRPLPCLFYPSRLQITRYVATDAAGGQMAASTEGTRRSAFLDKFLKSNTTE